MEIITKPKTDYTPAALDEPAKLLLRAADVIEAQGWCQKFVGSRDGKVCLEGALMVAYGKSPTELIEASRVPMEASRRVRRAVGTDAFRWNDEKGRTKDEVVAKLRAVALGGQ